MAPSSIYFGNESNFNSKFEEDIQQVISHRNIPKCKGVPCHLWTTKCVSLHNDNGVAMAQGIYHSISSDLTIGTRRPLGNMHVVV
jgi:hypothetical protein